MNSNFHIERDPRLIFRYFPEIISLGNVESHSLGFLPKQAIQDGISGRKMLIAIDQSVEPQEFIGYLLYSGVFPHAKIQQIVTTKNYRNCGVASTLLRSLIVDLENVGFMTIRADIGSDLPESLAFYRRKGFIKVKTRSGGTSRNRQIITHILDLNTDTLFTRSFNSGDYIDLGIRIRSAREISFFALDLNVYFDLVKDRSQSEAARKLFGAALDHQVRLMVADEFVAELRRTSDSEVEDPILELALRLPRMPKADRAQLTHLQTQVHDLVFDGGRVPGAESRQAWSDAGHLAHAALARASAFITRDGAILTSRESLLRRFGIDVLSVQELLITLPSNTEDGPLSTQYGAKFVCATAGADTIRAYMRREGLPSQLIADFATETEYSAKATRLAITGEHDTLACGVLLSPRAPREACRLFIHAGPNVRNNELYIDHLLDSLLREATKTGSTSVALEPAEGVRSLLIAARARGFSRKSTAAIWTKVALGRPVTPRSWNGSVQNLRLRTGVELPTAMPVGNVAENFPIRTIQNVEFRVSVRVLENMLSPALFIRPDQDGVIVPITRGYSELLLGDNIQMSLAIEDKKDAIFLFRRAYVNAPRAAHAMLPDSPILFYESKKTGGVGGVVAAARIVDTEIRDKADVPEGSLRRLVVDDISSFSNTQEILVTSFENIFIFPYPVPLDWLKGVGAADNANLITARRISGAIVGRVLDKGWNDE